MPNACAQLGESVLSGVGSCVVSQQSQSKQSADHANQPTNRAQFGDFLHTISPRISTWFEHTTTDQKIGFSALSTGPTITTTVYI